MKDDLNEIMNTPIDVDEAMVHVNELREYLQSGLRKRASQSGGDAVLPPEGEEQGDTIVIGGVTYKKV